jgi:hypothetical protein
LPHRFWRQSTYPPPPSAALAVRAFLTLPIADLSLRAYPFSTTNSLLAPLSLPHFLPSTSLNFVSSHLPSYSIHFLVSSLSHPLATLFLKRLFYQKNIIVLPISLARECDRANLASSQYFTRPVLSSLQPTLATFGIAIPRSLKGQPISVYFTSSPSLLGRELWPKFRHV